MADIDVAAKREVRAAQGRTTDAYKAERKVYRRCFWTRPLGHAWEYDGRHNEIRTCAGCGKTQKYLHDSQGGSWS